VIPIKPLTLLVGENSTGKSAFIASIAALSDATRFPLNPGFNSPPFELGSYETIASRRLSGKKVASFTIGFEDKEKASSKHTELSATYIDKLGHVLFSHLNLDSDVGQLKVHLDNNNLSLSVAIPAKKEKRKILFKVDGKLKVSACTLRWYFFSLTITISNKMRRMGFSPC
jgi:predicted ATP-binding protein involved in virulence